MKNSIKIVALVIVITIISCGKEKTTIVDNRETVNVKVSTPSFENNSFISASGKIEAVQSANLSTRMMGFVNNINVNVGDKVTKGQLLLSINSSDINAQKAQISASIAEATAALKNAEKDFNRYKALFDDKSASQKEMDDMTAHYEMSKARLESANQMKNQVNAQLSYSNIKAPFSGIITNKFINKGDMANPGMPLLSIETPGKYQVISMVSESDITSIKNGSNVTVVIKSTNKLVSGKVTEVSSSAKNTGGQYFVKILLEKTDIKLLSGMFTSVQFTVENNSIEKNTILIPQNILVKQGQLSGVYTIGSENTAILRWLRIGKTFGNQVEVLSGLSANEQFIISAEGKLFNGAKVSLQ
ncbi:MAG: efflux RND transporter periplasmic adaptor subunit [Lutibacter sp.]|nr:efflux RND transporter periplasmic adaptor subunit [Lutibacter sp.]